MRKGPAKGPGSHPGSGRRPREDVFPRYRVIALHTWFLSCVAFCKVRLLSPFNGAAGR